MRSLFHGWLARPHTLRQPKHLLASGSIAIGHGQHCRNVALAARYTTNGDDAPASEVDGSNGPPIRRVIDKSREGEEMLGMSVREYSMRASLSAGVLLTDGRAESKASFVELMHQSDVDNDRKVGKLLVDSEEHRHNHQLWIELMQFKRRIAGDQGVVDVWNGMKRRGVDLPTEGEEANIIWAECIRVTCECDADSGKVEKRVQKDIIDYTASLKKRTGKVYEPLYQSLIGKLFTIANGPALSAHDELVRSGLGPQAGELKQVVKNVLENPFPVPALRTFMRIYNSIGERDHYDHAIPLVLELCGPEHALMWHRMFVKVSDRPSEAILAMPEVQQLFELDRNGFIPLPFRTSDKGTELSRTVEARAVLREHPPLTREAMSTLVGEAHGIKPKEISDAFIAKMFATSAFTLDLIVTGLSFFAIQQLGPLAVREVAVRAGSAVAFCDVLVDLKSMNITLADTAYCRLVTKIASDGHEELFDALLASDQHPESYDDTRTQEALLTEYLDQERWANANVTMTSLTLSGVPCERRAINLLVQHYLRNRSWRLVSSTIQKMQAERVAPTEGTLTDLFRYMLPERRPANAPKRQHPHGKPPFDGLDFVTKVFMYSQDISANVSPYYWKELLKRYGLTYRWEGVEKLCLWLSSHESMRSLRRNIRDDGRLVVLERTQLPITEILTLQMQQAIFAWGFKAAALRQQLCMPLPSVATGADVDKKTNVDVIVDHPWTQGLRLLQRINSSHFIDDHNLQRAFVNRMWILFGPGMSFKPFNEFVKRTNTLQLSDYIRQAREAYHDFDLAPEIHPEILEDTSPHQALLKLAFFGPYRQASTDSGAKEQNWTDVTAWTRDLLDGKIMQPRGVSTPQRRQQWYLSPYRVAKPRQSFRRIHLH